MDMLDISFLDRINAIGGTFIVIASYLFGEHWVLFAALLVLNVIDYITGVMKSRSAKTESSSAGLLGIKKKFGYWVIVCLAFLMGPLLIEIGELIGADFSMVSPLIGYFILAMFIFNEFRSILENLTELGVPVPKVMINGLEIVQKNLVKAFDGTLNVDKSSDDKYKVDIKESPEDIEKKDMVVLKIKTISEDEE